MDKVIITVAPTGGFHGKSANPNLPEQPEEIAQTAIECWREGASVIHIHARDKNGEATGDPVILSEIREKIRARNCDAVIAFSTGIGGKSRPSFETRMGVLDARPEMASLNMGTIVRTFGDEHIGAHPRSKIEALASKMKNLSIKPEMEIYSQSMIREMQNLIEKELVSKPYLVNFVLGMKHQNSLEATPKDLISLISYLPEDTLFNVCAMSNAQLPMTVLSILLGGHARVGFEDNIYYSRGVLAESNRQLVARTVRICREIQKEIASPAEARAILGLAKL